MENTNNPTVPPQPTAPLLPVITTPPATVVAMPETTIPGSVPPTPKQKFSVNDIKNKFNNLPKNMKILILLVPVFFISIFLLLVTGLGGRVRNSILPTPTPVPTATPSVPEIANPSAYANDPEVLDLESKLSDFDKKLSQVELREDTIRPPTVDWDVNFKK